MTESDQPSPNQTGLAQQPAAGAAPAAPAPAPVRFYVEGVVRPSFWRRVVSAVGLFLFVGALGLNVVLLCVLSATLVGPRALRTTVLRPGEDDQVVALVEIAGFLDGEQARLAERFWRQVRKDPKVKAVVLRVDSPGGGISACDRIYKYMKDLRRTAKKKLVVSMGGVAASGGYYIAAPADAIFAENTTVTGSIGVIGQIWVLKETLGKLGMKVRLLPSSKARAWKAAGNIFEETPDYQVAEFQKIIDDMHEMFEAVVRRERNITPKPATRTYKDAAGKEFTVEEVEPFNGRIFLAERAKDLGLVDKLGYLEDAIEEAKTLAGLTRPKVVRYAPRKTLLQEMGSGTGGKVGLDAKKILHDLQTPRVMMVWKLGQ